jgi:hypothetical protein
MAKQIFEQSDGHSPTSCPSDCFWLFLVIVTLSIIGKNCEEKGQAKQA